MENIVGYICSTPWGTVSRTTPSLGWTPVLPAIPDGWQDAGTGAAPTGFRIIVRPGTRFPTLFPKMPRAELAAVHAPDTEPGRWSLCWDHASQSWEMRRGVAAEAAFIRSCSPPRPGLGSARRLLPGAFGRAGRAGAYRHGLGRIPERLGGGIRRADGRAAGGAVMSALADRHLGEAFVRLRLRLGQLPPEYLRLPALIHEGLTQQIPDYAAAVWRLEGMLGRGLNEALDEAAFITAYAALGLPGKVEKAKGVP